MPAVAGSDLVPAVAALVRAVAGQWAQVLEEGAVPLRVEEVRACGACGGCALVPVVDSLRQLPVVMANVGGADGGCAGCVSVGCGCDDCVDCECDESEGCACGDCGVSANAASASAGYESAHSSYPIRLLALPTCGQLRHHTLSVPAPSGQFAGQCNRCLERHLHTWHISYGILVMAY